MIIERKRVRLIDELLRSASVSFTLLIHSIWAESLCTWHISKRSWLIDTPLKNFHMDYWTFGFMLDGSSTMCTIHVYKSILWQYSVGGFVKGYVNNSIFTLTIDLFEKVALFCCTDLYILHHWYIFFNPDTIVAKDFYSAVWFCFERFQFSTVQQSVNFLSAIKHVSSLSSEQYLTDVTLKIYVFIVFLWWHCWIELEIN